MAKICFDKGEWCPEAREMIEAMTGRKVETKVGHYTCGTIDGIYDLNVEKAYTIVAIWNKVPHNGALDEFLSALEEVSDREKKPVRIVEFYNDRLRQHILKRKGWVLVVADGSVKYGGWREN